MSFITAQVYTYFEYFQNDLTEKTIFIFLVIFHYLCFKIFKNIKLISIKKLTFYILRLNLLFIVFLLYLFISILSIWPYGANHTNFNTFLIALILIFYTLNYIENKKIELNLISNRKYLICSLAILYYSAAIHKMNFDFYEPNKSCTTWYHLKLLSRFFNDINLNDIPYFIKRVSPQIVGSIELIAPTLLFFKNTRVYAIFLLIFLHSYLALGGFSDFSSLAFCILYLILPISQINMTKWIQRVNFHFLSSYLIIVICLIGAYFYNDHRETLQTLQGIVLLAVTLSLLINVKEKKVKFKTETKNNLNYIELIKFIPCIALAVFGSSIYFGYRSSGNFTMFSNLKFTGQHNNHLFMKKIDLFGYEKELFQIINTYDESIFSEVRQPLDWITKAGIDLAFHRAKILNISEKFSLTVKSEKGVIFELDNLNIQKFLGPEKSWFFYKTYNYSFIPDSSSIDSCRW